jgi:hypothetical protein
MFLSTTGGRLFVNGLEDEATTCTFSRGCCEVIRTAEKAVCGGLSHLRKYDLLNIFKTNIPLRLLIYTIITLIAGVCHQIVKYTGKHRYDIAHVLKIIVLIREYLCLQIESPTPY